MLGLAQLVFRGYGRVNMDVNSQIQVSGRPDEPVKVVLGKVDLLTLGTKRDLGIETPHSRIQLKHTQVHVSVDADGTTLTVIQGQVRFYNEYGQQTVGRTDAQGNQIVEQSTARRDEAPTKPVSVSVADLSQLIAWEATVESLTVPIEVPLAPPGAKLERLLPQRERAARLNPEDADARVAWGDVLQDAGRLVEARAAYDRALELQPGHVKAQAHRAQLDLREGNQDEAVAAFTALDGGAPASAEGALGLAMVALSRGDVAGAAEPLNRAAARDPNDPRVPTFRGLALLRNNDLVGAEAALRRAGSFAPAHAYRSYLLTLRNQLPEAAAAAAEAVKLAPDSSLSHQAQASALFYAGKTGEAEAEIKEALKANPVSAPAWLTQAKIIAAQDRLGEAVRAARQAVALDPRNPVGYTTLGVMLLARNDTEGAERMFKEAQKRAPDLSEAWTGLAQVSIQRGQFNQALQRQEGALDPDRADTAAALNNLGAIYLARGELDKAREKFLQAADPRSPWKLPLANLAQVYLEQNQYAKALQAAEEAARGGENSAVLRTTLARVFKRLGRTDRALAELQQAEALDPDYPQAQFQLARLYLDQGRDQDALRSILRAASVHPGAMVENRLYARTEATLAGGNNGGRQLDGKTDGRALNGVLSYFMSGTHSRSDNDRLPNAEQEQTFGEALAGYERNPSHQWLLYSTKLDQRNGRPGLLINNSRDLDFRSEFEGEEAHLIHRLSTGLRSNLTLKVGFRNIDLEDRNPNSLTSVDPKQIRRLVSRNDHLLAEARWDARISPASRLTAGFGWRDERRRVNGEILGVIDPTTGSPRPGPLDPDVRVDATARTFYAEWWRRANDRLELKVGGRLDRSSEANALGLPKVVLQYRPSGRSYLVFLTYPTFPSDATEISPVEAWSQPFGIDRVGYTDSGYARSYELHYQHPSSRLSMLTITAFTREARGLLLDLEDPQYAPTSNLFLVARARIRGAQMAYEHGFSPTFSVRLFVRYADTEDRATGQELPYFSNWQGGLRFDYLNRAGWRGFLALTQEGPRVTLDTRSLDPDARRRLAGSTLVDLRIARQLDTLHSLFVQVSNLLDRDRAPFEGYPASGRTILGGIEYRFK
jgi:tetratricopeptide (TPR) repeat protein